jgi:hypothetical protein
MLTHHAIGQRHYPLSDGPLEATSSTVVLTTRAYRSCALALAVGCDRGHGFHMCLGGGQRMADPHDTSVIALGDVRKTMLARASEWLTE